MKITPKANSTCPQHMIENIIEYEFLLDEAKKNDVWTRLQLRETFTKGQIPPYRVDFESGKESGPFYSGEKNSHHGPLLSVHGEIGDITDNYRSLFYYYGSYVISFRFVRPWLLEFIKTESGIKMKLHSYVHPSFLFFWKIGNNIFWKFFGINFLF